MVRTSASVGPLGFVNDGILVSDMIGVRGSWEQEADRATDARYNRHEDRRMVDWSKSRAPQINSACCVSGSFRRLFSLMGLTRPWERNVAIAHNNHDSGHSIRCDFNCRFCRIFPVFVRIYICAFAFV
jgi:hypothetical protein